MSTPQLERLRTHCQRLRLHRVEAELSTLLELAARNDVSYADFFWAEAREHSRSYGSHR